MKLFRTALLLPVIAFGVDVQATAIGFAATLGGVNDCTGAVACTFTSPPPNPVVANPNDNTLRVWNERQNVLLTEDLPVDRVADPGAAFVKNVSGNLFIAAGTIVSSHYVQWDPAWPTHPIVDTSIVFDSDIFAFITADQKLFDSDATLGLPGLDYADFTNRGLEPGDTTAFRGSQVDISWNASAPGDWTRLITAFSPAAAAPEPASWLLLAAGLLGAGLRARSTGATQG